MPAVAEPAPVPAAAVQASGSTAPAARSVGGELVWSGTPARAAQVAAIAPRIEITVGTSMAETKRRLVQPALEHVQFNKEAAAAVLGIRLKTIHNRLRQYRSGSLAANSDGSA